MKKIDRTGSVFKTNEGYEVTIIKYYNSKNVLIEFNDKIKFSKIVNYTHLINGNISNPYHKSLLNVGFLGCGDFATNHKFYSIWRSMLMRCYNKNYHIKYPTYKDVTVCEDWHCFQNFAKWCQKNYVENWHLDKDVILKGNKIYCPECCALIPPEINYIFIKGKNKRGLLPIGVCKHKNKLKSALLKYNKQIYLGSFDCQELAFLAYKKAKEQYIKEVAEKWKNLISSVVYDAMYKYNVEIND